MCVNARPRPGASQRRDVFAPEVGEMEDDATNLFAKAERVVNEIIIVEQVTIVGILFQKLAMFYCKVKN